MIFSTDFEILTLAILAVITISQSLFGVGILLWGTPIFLLLGENFIQTLALLLPLSLMVSFLQILPSLNQIDKNMTNSIYLFTCEQFFRNKIGKNGD